VRDLLVGMSVQLRALAVGDEPSEEVLGLRIDLAAAVGHLNALDACLAAVRAEQETVAAEREVQLMLRSLHRVGDHTMDADEEQTLRPPCGGLQTTANTAIMEATR